MDFCPAATSRFRLPGVKVPIWHLVWMGFWTGYTMAVVGEAAGIFALPYQISILQFANVRTSRPTTQLLTFLNPLGALLGFHRTRQTNWDFALWVCAGGVVGAVIGPFIRLTAAGRSRSRSRSWSASRLRSPACIYAWRHFAAFAYVTDLRASSQPPRRGGARCRPLAVRPAARSRHRDRREGRRLAHHLLLGRELDHAHAGALPGRARRRRDLRRRSGVGGGFLLVPIFAAFYRLPIYVLVAASIPYVLSLSAVSLFTYSVIAPLFTGTAAAGGNAPGACSPPRAASSAPGCAAKTQRFVPQPLLKLMLGAITGLAGALYILGGFVAASLSDIGSCPCACGTDCCPICRSLILAARGRRGRPPHPRSLLVSGMANEHRPAARRSHIDHVTKAYGDEFAAKTVVRDCSFTVASGNFTVLIGPSGCGKTTLINLIAGYERPTEGRITVDGQDVAGPTQDRLVVFQETALVSLDDGAPERHVRSRWCSGASARAETRSRGDRICWRASGLKDFHDKYPNQLSGGMQRRAELARALINRPSCLLMDEPFRGLDAMTRQLMQEYLLKLFEGSGQTILFVTSEIDEAILLADKTGAAVAFSGLNQSWSSRSTCRARAIRACSPRQRYAELKSEALSVLYDEALEAFASGSRAAADLVEAFELRRGGGTL